MRLETRNKVGLQLEHIGNAQAILEVGINLEGAEGKKLLEGGIFIIDRAGGEAREIVATDELSE